MKEKERKMIVNDFVCVDYANGKKYDGRVVSVRIMPNDKTLFTVRYYNPQKDSVVKYASLYMDKCVSVNFQPWRD
jgi:hypothetical protein